MDPTESIESFCLKREATPADPPTAPVDLEETSFAFGHSRPRSSEGPASAANRIVKSCPSLVRVFGLRILVTSF